MPRLVSPLGAVVSVSEEKASRLGSGWRPFEDVYPAEGEKPVARKPRVKKAKQD